jgi:hypothetical protein
MDKLTSFFTAVTFILFCSGQATAQTVSDSANIIIPFNRAGNLILIKGRVDSTEGNFILDTGAPGLVLNITYFRNYHSTPADDRNGISGSISNAVQTTVTDFSFGSKHFYQVQADLISLGHIEDTKKVKVLGLIGVAFSPGLN